MNRSIGSAEIDKSLAMEIGKNIHGAEAAVRQPEQGDHEISADNLAVLLRRVSEASTREVENLIGELQALRKKLHTDGNRIQRDVADYSELSQGVVQLTAIVSENVKRLPKPTC